MLLQKDLQKKVKEELITCCMDDFSHLSSENCFTHMRIIICIALGLVTRDLPFCSVFLSNLAFQLLTVSHASFLVFSIAITSGLTL